jgi:hypothetical protein
MIFNYLGGYIDVLYWNGNFKSWTRIRGLFIFVILDLE